MAHPSPAQTVNWGVTFSQPMSESLGLNWRDNYLAILNDLQPQGIRLVAYWNRLEPKEGEWHFEDLDWQIKQASEHRIPIILAVGIKAPRWPECHTPDWFDSYNSDEQKEKLFRYLTTIVTRYQSEPLLDQWQVENEPFIHFGTCTKLDANVLDQEIALVKKLDSHHSILVTDGGAWGRWYGAAKRGDTFGTTLYTKVYHPRWGYTHPPFPPIYYAWKGRLIRWLTGRPHQKMIVTEVGLEPWGGKAIEEMTLEEQVNIFTLQDFHSTVAFAQATHFDTYYAWGAEWWYATKLKGESDYWQAAQMLMNRKTVFPSNFLWGASTAAHQVEGNNHNDWTAWEQANADRLAQTAEKDYGHTLASWPAVKEAATNPANYISGQATDHYHHYQEDFTIAQSLGMNAQRISIEWSRIEPTKGQFDEKELAHYRDVITDLQSKGMEPFVTLWHYTIPVWFRDQGGWLAPTAEDDFTQYVKKVVSAYPEVTYWITMNEPGIYTTNAYLLGIRPPQEKNPWHYFQALHKLVRTHQASYTAIKTLNPKAQVGIAQDMFAFTSSNFWPDRVAKRLATWWRNNYFLNQIQAQQDFIGVNYYLSVPLGLGGMIRDPEIQASDLGWGLHPEGIYQALMSIKSYHKPIYITENGLADAKDNQRAEYIKQVLTSVHQALADGVDVRGYFYWSLLDNFEWEKGFWPRFGLVAIDYTTEKRTIRPSAYDYAAIIKRHALKK